MMPKIRALLQAYREQILYLFFGGLTTAVDWGISFLLYRFWIDAYSPIAGAVHLADLFAWLAAVLFAFFTNRIWVFRSTRRGFRPVAKELMEFAGGRVFTLLIQEAIIAIFVTGLGWNKYLFRIPAAVLVIILNYIISKLFVFKKNKNEPQDSKKDQA